MNIYACVECWPHIGVEHADGHPSCSILAGWHQELREEEPSMTIAKSVGPTIPMYIATC